MMKISSFCLAFGLFSFNLVSCIGSSLPDDYISYLPDCTTDSEVEKDFFIVSTYDGKLSMINAVSGSLKWSKQIDAGPLISSTIGDFIVFNKNEIVQVLLSLDGNIYVSNGQSVRKANVHPGELEKNSIKFGENILLAGGQESSIIGLNADNGEIVYECGQKDCTQNASTSSNIVWLRKISQTVRALNVLNGKEEWHFIVNDPQIIKVPNQDCAQAQNEKSYSINFTVFAPTGIMKATVTQNNMNGEISNPTWNIKLDSPIANMWRYQNNNLEKINLFSSKVLNADCVTQIHENLQEPHFYIGTYNNQFYIQKSIFHKETDLITYEVSSKDVPLLENKLLKQIAIKDTIIMDNTNFEITKYNSHKLIGYYSFDANQSNEKYLKSDNHFPKNVVQRIFYAFVTYWKEISAICATSWIFLSFISSFFNNRSTSLEAKSFSGLQIQEKTHDTLLDYENSDIMEEVKVDGPSKLTYTSAYMSRYMQDFEQVCLIGKGGFGMVFEAKHKIDESHYAVKRISIPTNEEKRDRFMREIKALSKLDHTGIVRYFNAWIEEPPIGWQENFDKQQNYEITETIASSETQSESYNYSNRFSFKLNDIKSNDSLEIVFEETEEQDNHSSTKSKYAKLDEKETSTFDTECRYTIDNYQSSTNKSVENNRSDYKQKNHVQQTAKVYVYIQMQLCKKETLKDWLFHHKNRDKNEMIRIFKQIIDAVHYVHSNKLIHRDLKPSNIFFSMDGLIKIGDFGLVTNIIEGDSEQENNSKSSNGKHTNRVGTQLYMSPEQVRNNKYDHKVDIFSMGIILYELLNSFSTESERIDCLINVRKKIFPSEFMKKHSNELEVLKKLLSYNPDNRPESVELKEHFKNFYC